MAPSFSPATTRLGRSAVQDGIIGFKTSAAFFSSLGDNLRLNSASPLPSPVIPPQHLPKSTDDSNVLLPKNLKPLSLSIPPAKAHRPTKSFDSGLVQHSEKGQRSRKNSIAKSNVDLSDDDDEESSHVLGPSHTVYLTTTQSVKDQALDTLSWTVRFQSFSALRALYVHPLNVAILALLFFFIERLVRASVRIEHNGQIINAIGTLHLWMAVLTTWSSLVLMVTATVFIALRLPYREASMDINSEWLGDDEVIIATSSSPTDNEDSTKDPKVIGTLILSWRLREVPGFGKCRKPRRIGRGVIRGWGVSWRQTRKGVGEALLREAARVVSARGGDGLAFAEDHAHCQVVLPDFYNGAFERRNRDAKWKVEDIWEQMRGSPRRR